MASTTIFAIGLSLVLQASFSLPIGKTPDVNTVELSDGVPVRKSVFTEKRPDMLDHLPRSSEDIYRVQSLTLIEALPSAEVLGKRVKREVMTSGKQLCSGDTVEFLGRCWTKERYEAYKKDEGAE